MSYDYDAYVAKIEAENEANKTAPRGERRLPRVPLNKALWLSLKEREAKQERERAWAADRAMIASMEMDGLL